MGQPLMPLHKLVKGHGTTVLASMLDTVGPHGAWPRPTTTSTQGQLALVSLLRTNCTLMTAPLMTKEM